jgi:hypothetical protein
VTKDDDIRGVAARLDGLLDELQVTVGALNSILVQPPDEPDTAGKELAAP